MAAVSQSQQPAPAPTQPAGNSGTGLDPKVAILLCWIFSPLSSIIFIATEKNDKRIKFHAWQSLFYVIAAIVVSVALAIISAILTAIVPAMFCITTPLYSILGLAFFIVPIVAIVKAYNGEDWKLPMIGDMADKQANK